MYVEGKGVTESETNQLGGEGGQRRETDRQSEWDYGNEISS